MNLKQAIALMLGMTLWVGMWAQPKVRPEDYFWKRRVVNRIPLNEKINQPYVVHEASYYGDSSPFRENDGLVASLIHGLKDGRYLAYDPYDWERVMTYEEVYKRMLDNEQAITGEEEYTTDEDASLTDIEMFERAEEEGYGDEWTDDGSGGLGADEEDLWGDEDLWGEPVEEEVATAAASVEKQEIDLFNYEQVFHLVEDWIFDKTRSMMVQEIDFIEIIWVDPSGLLPETVLARFRWEDVQDQLRHTQWKNRFNDANSHSIAQALTLRLFHGFFINIGGTGITTLWEAERRRQEIVEFEHHLWSY